MAKASLEVIMVIRSAAEKIGCSPDYQWGHMGACNCGFLAQEITKLTKAQIHERALMRHGDWREQLNDYCPLNGLPFDEIISELISYGFDADDLRNLEQLSDQKVTRLLKPSILRHNVKGDVVCYMKTWATMLENQLLDKISLPSIENFPSGKAIYENEFQPIPGI